MKILTSIKNSLKNKKKIFLSRGFTIAEMLVVLAIFIVISGIVLFNFSDFKSNVGIENLAQDIALSVRKTQSYALSTKGNLLSGSPSTIFPGYGIHFSTESSVTAQKFQGSNKSFIIFADIPPGVVPLFYEYKYDSGVRFCDASNLASGNECLEEIKISSTDYISEICDDTNSTPNCITGSLDITFKRPNPDATFCFIPTGAPGCSGTSTSAYITISSLSGKTQKIKVWNTGQISIE